MRLRWSSILFAALCAAIVGCLSPTLPLPPPATPMQSDGAQPGTIHLHGVGVEANALVIIRNNFPNASENLTKQEQVGITLADAQGVWDADVFAVKGDTLEIWQDLGNNDESPTIDFQVN
jgi:hypothetical protein